MSGIKTTYTASTADVRVKYSTKHWWCWLYVFMPVGASATAVFGVLRGGGGISQPAIWDAAFSPDAEIVNKETADLLLAAGVAVVYIEYPNFPHSSIGSRHFPTYRSPHSWRIIVEALQFLQTHALDGRVTGSRSIVLPSKYTRYVLSGVSAGALFASEVALMPDGLVGYDTGFGQSIGAYTYLAGGKVKGVVLGDPTIEFRTYSPKISGQGIQFAGVSERFYPDVINSETIHPSVQRWKGLTIDNLRDIGSLDLLDKDLAANRHVGMFVNSATSFDECSYMASGMTLAVTAWSGSSPTSAVTIERTDDATRGGVVKLASIIGTTLYLYIEPNGLTTSGFPDDTVVDYWVATPLAPSAAGYASNETPEFLLKDAAGTTVGTIASSVLGIVQKKGADTYKTFLTRAQALALVGTTFPSFPELNTPHVCINGAMLKRSRDAIFARHGLPSIDRFYLGSEYPAQISGDVPSFAFNGLDYAASIVDWMETELGIDL